MPNFSKFNMMIENDVIFLNLLTRHQDKFIFGSGVPEPDCWGSVSMQKKILPNKFFDMKFSSVLFYYCTLIVKEGQLTA